MFNNLGLIIITLAMQITPGWGQVRKLHTRDMTRLSQVQVADYLKQKDIIFIPVGAVETNGIMPSDRDYVSPLAYAMAMAEDTGALYMPGLVWSFPGTTVVAPATIYLTPGAGTAYLKILAKSLLRQGFRRQVWLSAGQGPAPLTVGTLVREFFEETHVPILYIDMDTYFPKLKLAADARSKTLYGAHYITGRIEDIPLKGDYGLKESQAAGAVPENTGLAALGKLGLSGSLSLGSYIPDVMAHGGGQGPALPASAAEREEWGKQGRAQIVAIVKQMRLGEAMEALRQHDKFTQDVLVPKFGNMLPTPNDSR
jgi:creatinine amidohydrolase